MDSPPAKRQRRLKAAFSEDEELELDSPQQVVASGGTQRSTSAITGKANRPQDSTKSTRSKAKSKSNNEESKATRRKVASKAESVSPKTSQKSPGKKTPEKKSTSLHTFFARASEEQRWNRKADTPNKEADDVKTPDAIEDDDESSDETFPLLGESKGDMTFQLDRRKDRVAWTRNGSPTFRTGLSVSNQKFVKPPVPTVRRSKLKADVEDSSNTCIHRPWADRYGPANLEELAVHRKKVGDLQKWLDEVLNGRDPRVCAMLNIMPFSLILTGR